MHQSVWRRSALCMPVVALGLVVTMASPQSPRVIEVKTRRYGILCTEECGKGHEGMVGTLIVTAVTQ